MPAWLDPIDSLLTRAVVALFFAALLALAARWLLLPLLARIARRSASQLDDEIIRRLGRPVVASILLVGVSEALAWLDPATTTHFVVFGLLHSVAVLLWAQVLVGIGVLLLQALSGPRGLIQAKTLPLFTMIWKILVYGGATYFLMAAWHINVTTWLASAGVVGIAVGFAAKDTLANLFAGVFIIGDAPFKIGDFIVIDGVTRGEVTEIGLRSSRILTRDDVEVTVPNAVIGNAMIVNETGGPRNSLRVRIQVSVAYGSDVTRVREVLLACSEDVQNVIADPEPRVRFRSLGDSGLQFELLVWVLSPVFRGQVIDTLNERVYNALRAAGIEIPYPKQDVYIRRLPERD